MSTYFDDCSSLSAWAEVGVVAGTDYSISGGAIVKSASNLDMLKLSAVDSDAERQDCEVLVKVNISSVSTTHYVAIVRGTDGGSISTANGYLVALRSTAIRTFKKVNGTITQISEQTGKTHSANTDYWVRLRINSTTLQTRSWADGGSEPGTWDCDATNSDISGDGYAGLHGTANTATHTWSACGVGTNGDTAPSSAGGGAAALASALSASASVSAALTTSITCAAAVSASATVSATLASGAAALAAGVSGASTVSAALTTSIRCAASVSASATTSAALTAGAGGLEAAVSASASVSAALTTAIRLNAALQASATVSASLAGAAAALQAAASGSATVSATLSTAAAALASAVIAQAQTSAALTTAIRLAALAQAAATSSAALTAGALDVFTREPIAFTLLGVPSSRTVTLSKPARQIGALLKG